MENNAVTQTSLEESVYKKQVDELKKQRKTLEGKLSGYAFLGDRLKEKSDECRRLEQEREVLKQKLLQMEQQNVTPNFLHGDSFPIQTEEKDIQTSLLNGDLNLKQLDNAQKLYNMTSSTTKSSVHTTDLFPSENRAVISNRNGFNTMTFEDETKLRIVETPKDLLLPKSADLFPSGPSGPKFPVYEPPACSPTIDRNDQFLLIADKNNTSQSDTSFGVKSSNGFNIIQRTETDKKTRKTGETPLLSGDLMMFSRDRDVAYPPVIHQTNSDKSEELLSIRLATQTVQDLSLDGPQAEIRKFLEETLIPELSKSEEKQKQLEKINEALKREISKLRERNNQLQDANLFSPSPSLSSQTHLAEWDYVKTSEAVNAPLQGSGQSALSTQNKKLSDANKRWQEFYEVSSKKHSKENDENEAKILQLQQEIESMKIQDKQKRDDFERILYETKQSHSNEEIAKEELQGQLVELKGRYSAVQAELQEVKTALAFTTQEKNMLLTQMNTGDRGTPRYGKSYAEMEAEIGAMRQQLTLFQEDFDKERRDRAQAQSLRDQLQSDLDASKRELKSVQSANKGITRQLQSAETNVRQTMMFNHRLQQEVSELKNKLRAEREAIARPYYPPIPQPVQYPVPSSSPPRAPFYNPTRPQQHNTREILQSVQPQEEPYAEPVPQYKLQQQQANWNNPTAQNGGPMYNPPAAKDWRCPQCTLENSALRIVCDACGYNRIPTNTGNLVNGQRRSPSLDLMPRGDAPDNQNDLCTDTGNFTK